MTWTAEHIKEALLRLDENQGEVTTLANAADSLQKRARAMVAIRAGDATAEQRIALMVHHLGNWFHCLPDGPVEEDAWRVYGTFKLWISDLVGWDAPAEWYVEHGYSTMIDYLVRRMDL